VTGSGPLRRAEVVGALSLATDLGLGLPLESGLRGAVLAAGLARHLGADDVTAEDAYSLAVLRFIGCTASSDVAADFFGDEIAFNAESVPAFYGDPSEVGRFMLSRLGGGAGAGHKVATLGRFLVTGKQRMQASAAAHCEVAQMLASRLGYRDDTTSLLAHIYDRYDGKGMTPAKAEQIPLAARVMHVARDAAACHAAHGIDAAVELVRRRAGRGYDPEVAEAFSKGAQSLCAPLESPEVWGAALDAEPGAQPCLVGEGLDSALLAMADFADLKSRCTPGHSRQVATLAADAAASLGLPADEVVAVRRAGLLHDLGRVAVSVTVWDRPGPLSVGDWEQVRLHAYHTERVLQRAPSLRPLGVLASHHHERVDGSGYHRGASGGALGTAARVLAAADAFQAMTQSRPHREASSADAAARTVRAEAVAGRLDAIAVQSVLEAAGQRRGGGVRRHVAGLTDRELEVLRLLSQGFTTAQLARRLGISAKTADHHIQRIYAKASVSSRAAATVFALQHHLVPQPIGAGS